MKSILDSHKYIYIPIWHSTNLLNVAPKMANKIEYYQIGIYRERPCQCKSWLMILVVSFLEYKRCVNPIEWWIQETHTHQKSHRQFFETVLIMNIILKATTETKFILVLELCGYYLILNCIIKLRKTLWIINWTQIRLFKNYLLNIFKTNFICTWKLACCINSIDVFFKSKSSHLPIFLFVNFNLPKTNTEQTLAKKTNWNRVSKQSISKL